MECVTPAQANTLLFQKTKMKRMGTVSTKKRKVFSSPLITMLGLVNMKTLTICSQAKVMGNIIIYINIYFSFGKEQRVLYKITN